MTPEEEKKFYLDSLLDLEEEYKAGDISEKDYREIKASYTKKVSRIIKQQDKSEKGEKGEKEKGRDEGPPRGRRSKNYRVVVSLVIVLVLVGGAAAGILVSLNSGQRDSREEVTGEVRESSESILSDALDLLRTSLQSRDAFQLEDVINRLDAVLEESPANLQALRGKSLATYALGRTDESKELLDEALVIDPDNIETLSRLAEFEIAEGLYDEAQGYLNRIYDRTPPPTAQELQIFSVENTQNVVYFRRLLDEYGGGALANHDNPPQEFSDLGLPDVEIALLIARALVDPGLSEAAKEYEVAGLILDLSVREEPNNVQALLSHGSFFTNVNIYELGSEVSDAGFASLDRALELAPEELEAGTTTGITKLDVRTERARINLDYQRFDQALLEAREALKLSPDSDALKTLEGRILAVANRRDEALEAFNAALELNPNSELPKLYRVAVYYCEERFQESLDDADSVITFTTNQIASLEAEIRALAAQGRSTAIAQQNLANTQNIELLVMSWRNGISASMESGEREAALSQEFSCPLPETAVEAAPEAEATTTTEATATTN